MNHDDPVKQRLLVCWCIVNALAGLLVGWFAGLLDCWLLVYWCIVNALAGLQDCWFAGLLVHCKRGFTRAVQISPAEDNWLGGWRVNHKRARLPEVGT